VKTSTIIITVAIVLLFAAGGFFFYQQYYSRSSVTHWDLVPANALMVYERDECSACVEQVHSSSLWKIIEQASFYNKGLDSLKQTITPVLKESADLLVSIHVTKKDDFDFVFYVPDAKTRLASIIESFTRKKYTSRKRSFNNVEIHETGLGKQFLSWTFIDDVWVGSFTPFLIEDVVRTSSRKNGFKKEVSAVQKLSSVQEDAGNIYIQLSTFSQWLSLFYTGDKNKATSVGRSAILDIKSDDNHLVLNGFSADTADQAKYLLSIFHDQSPVPFNLKNLIANNTVAVHSFGVSDGSSFDSDLNAFVRKHSPRTRDSLAIVCKTAGVDVKKLYASIRDEVALCYVESAKQKKFSKVLVVETSDEKKWLTAFDKLAQRYSIDTIFYERYASYDIREVPVFRFTEKLLSPLVTGFDQSFYTSVDNHIVVADNLEDLKRFLDHLDEDETWGKSVSHNQFLETTLLESNFSIFINTPKVWNLLSAQLQPKWRQFLRENESLLRTVQLSAIQFSHVTNGYYTNVSIQYRNAPVSLAREVKKEKITTRFEHGVRGLYSVRSHVDRRDEILIQDSLNDLSLINNDGEAQWKISIGDRITSDVTQVDFFGNGKLQYFFTTTTGLHVIDRLGNYVEPFPALLSSIEYEYGVVVDYDHSKKYRFLVADKTGKLWMYDKQMENLEGWRPKDIGGQLAMAPGHHRIKGKDYILAVRKDGKVYMLNRRGETLKRFPIDAEGRPAGEYFLETGSGANDNRFILVTSDGYKVRFTVDGKLESREALFKNSVNSKFSLVAEKSFKSYVVVQQDNQNLIIYDESGKKLITNQNIGVNRASVEFYDFGSGRVYFILTDLDQGFSYMYDATGKLLNEMPFQTTLLALRPKDADENSLFLVENDMLTIQLIER
jgi:hypothetical protein